MVFCFFVILQLKLLKYIKIFDIIKFKFLFRIYHLSLYLDILRRL